MKTNKLADLARGLTPSFTYNKTWCRTNVPCDESTSDDLHEVGFVIGNMVGLNDRVRFPHEVKET